MEEETITLPKGATLIQDKSSDVVLPKGAQLIENATQKKSEVASQEVSGSVSAPPTEQPAKNGGEGSLSSILGISLPKIKRVEDKTYGVDVPTSGDPTEAIVNSPEAKAKREAEVKSKNLKVADATQSIQSFLKPRAGKLDYMSSGDADKLRDQTRQSYKNIDPNIFDVAYESAINNTKKLYRAKAANELYDMSVQSHAQNESATNPQELSEISKEDREKNYDNHIISKVAQTMTPQENEIYDLVRRQEALFGQNLPRAEYLKQRKELSDKIFELRDSPDAYSVVNGELLGKESLTDAQKEIAKQTDIKADKIIHTYKGDLGKALVKTQTELENSEKMLAAEKNEGGGLIGYNMLTEQGRAAHDRQAAIVAKHNELILDRDAMKRAYLLNKSSDVRSSDGFFKTMATEAVNGVPVLSNFFKDKSNYNYSKRIFDVSKVHGLETTSGQEKSAEMTSREELGAGTGQLINALPKLVLAGMATEGIGEITGLAKLVAPMIEKGATFLSKSIGHTIKSIEEAAKFKMAFDDASGGAGFYAGQQAIGAFKIPYSTTGFWGNAFRGIANYGIQNGLGGGVVGMTASEAAGSLTQALTTDRSFQSAFEDHFGDTADKQVKGVTQKLLMGLILGAPSIGSHWTSIREGAVEAEQKLRDNGMTKDADDIKNTVSKFDKELGKPLTENEEVERQKLKDKKKSSDEGLSKSEQNKLDDFNERESEHKKILKDNEAAEKEAKKQQQAPSATEPVVEVKAEVKPAGKRIFNEPVKWVKESINAYKKKLGITTPEGTRIEKIDTEAAKKRADAFEAMKHEPNNPEVKAAYEAMAKEVVDQYGDFSTKVKFEIYEGKGEPYKNSQEMLDDLEKGHLFILSTEKDFGQNPITDAQREENPLLRDSGIKDVNGKPMLVNDIFRGVHDAIHGESGAGFGAIGEENAWDSHARMFSPTARRAMTTETRGQNSWVNFGKHMRNEDGSIKKKGDEGYMPPSGEGARPFGEQKMGLLPEEFSKTDEELSVKTEKKSGAAMQKEVSDLAPMRGDSEWTTKRLEEERAQLKADPIKYADNKIAELKDSQEKAKNNPDYSAEDNATHVKYLQDKIDHYEALRLESKPETAAEQKTEKTEESHAGVSVKVDNAPEGNHLNIGMKVGRGDEMLTQEQILSKLPDGVKAESVSVVDWTEPTLAIKTSRKLTDAEMAKLMEDTQQQAIPQLTDGVGVLHDAKKGTSEGWGDFNPDYFVTQDGKKLSEAVPLTPKQKALKEIADAEAKASAPKEYTVDNIKNADTEDLPATGAKVVEDMKRVLPAIGRIVKEGTGNEVKLVVHNNPESFEKAVLNANGSKQDAASSGGFWMSKTGEIHLDINAVDSETGMHEGFHSILDHIEANNPEAIDKLFTQLEGVEGAEDIVAEAKRNYSGDVTVKKEAITDFIAKVADGQIKVDATNIEKVKHFISQALKTVGLDKLAEKFATDLGLDMSNAKDLQQLAKLITKKFSSGEDIHAEEFGGGGKIVSDKPQFMSFGGYEKNGYEETKEYKDLVKSGHIVENYNIAGIGGRRVYITSPDNMMVGNVVSGGNSVMAGEGGIHFVSKTGHVWAFKKSGDPMVKFINAEIKANGVAHIILTKGKLDKTLNTHDGAIGAMHVLEDLMDRGHIGTSVFRKALLTVGKKYKLDFSGVGDTKSIQESLKKGFYGVKNSTFEKRGNFISDFIAAITKAKDPRTDIEGIKEALNTDRTLGKDARLNADNLRAAIGGLFAEEVTLDAKTGEAYAVIEVKSPVESVKIDKEQGGHAAYPNHIVTKDGSRPKLLILDKPRYIGDVANNESNQTVVTKLDVTGKPKYPHQQLGSANTGFAMGVMKPSHEIDKPQFSKSDKVKGTYYEPHLTESKDKKDYVFFHVSGADKKSLEKGIDSQKHYSTRTSRDGKGLQYGVASYYTKPTDGERMVGGDKYAVHVPKNKVYPMDTDPNGYREAAEKKVKEGTPFREEKIKKEIAESAKGDGFMIAVGEWGHDRTGAETETPAMRADALVPLKPEKEMALEYSPATTKDIPHPDKEKMIQEKAMTDFAESVSNYKSEKGKFDDGYDIAEQVRMYGGIRNEDGTIRPLTKPEFQEMTKGLPKKLAEQAKVMQFSKSSGNKKVERHFDKYVEVAKEGIKEDPNYSIEDLAKDTGHDVKDLQKVWDEATGEKEEVKAEKEIGTKKVINDAARGDMGLEPLELPKMKGADENMAEAKKLVDDGEVDPDNIVDELLSHRADPFKAKISPADEAVLQYRALQLQQKKSQLLESKVELQKTLDAEPDNEGAKMDMATTEQMLQVNYDAIARSIDANQIGGNVWSKFGQQRQASFDERGQLINAVDRIKSVYGGEMPKYVSEQLDALQKKYDLLEAANAKLVKEHTKQAAQQRAQQAVAEAKKAARSVKKEDLEQRKVVIITNIKSKVAAILERAAERAGGKMNLVSDELPDGLLKDLSKDITDLMSVYAEQGVVKIDEIAEKIHENLKDTIAGLTTDHIKDVIAGKYSDKRPLSDLQKQVNDLRAQARLQGKISELEDGIVSATAKKGESSAEVQSLRKRVAELKKNAKNEYADVSAAELGKQADAVQKKIDAGEFAKQPTVKTLFEKDPEWIKNNKNKANLMFQLRQLEHAALNSQKSWLMRAEDWTNRWGRRVIFFGSNAVYTKLSSAAVLGSFAHRIPEQALGVGFARLIPRIAGNAPIEGAMNPSAEAKFYMEFLNPKKFAQNTWDIAKTGETELSREFGKYKENKHIPVVDLFAADAHIMIKDPVKRATFVSAFDNYMHFYDRNGVDYSHPLIMESARQAAYNKAENEIFQQSDSKGNAVGRYFNELEKSGIVQNNMPNMSDRVAGNAKYTAASLYHFFVPINTVPLNIMSRIWHGNPLIFSKNLVSALAKNNEIKKGILNLSHEESDIIMRQLKKGAIGSAYWTLGFCLAGGAGGLWNSFNKDPKNKEGKRRDGTHSGDLEVGGHEISHNVQHTAQLTALQMGATWRRTYDHYIKDKGASQFEALANATLSVAQPTVEGIPVAQKGIQLGQALTSPYGAKKMGEDLKRRVGVHKVEDVAKLMGYK